MCGIHGILTLRGAPPDPGVLARMAAVTAHRGPDDEGSFFADGVALGMRRLSIIDLRGGHQPISNEDGSVRVVCNGEIYNFRELRRQLIDAGHVFTTASDTEVIVHLYEQYGDEFVRHLDGMFGFALWDATRRRLLIGRDRLGIKPLYYRHDDSRVIFASELKAILEVPGVDAEIDHRAVEQYLALGYVPAPLSMIRGIRKLPPASLMVCAGGEVDIRRYWRPGGHTEHGRTPAQWIEELRETLRRAVESQMVSDVPLGAFLSGGIDSSAVVAMMAQASDQPIRTYAIGFDTGAGAQLYNELPFARTVAERFGTRHREILVKPDVAELLPTLLWHMDEPIADSAFITTYLVSRFAREDVTVILSGVGGDELFGGYRRYLGGYYARYYNALPRWLRRGVVQPLAARLPSDRHSRLMNLSRYARSFVMNNDLPPQERYRAYVQVFDRERRRALLRHYPQAPGDALGEALAEHAGEDELTGLINADLQTQLPDDLLMLTDKMSMATSLECRVPLLDTALVDLAARMPSQLKIRGRELKYVLKQALGTTLPDEILYRRKRGFGAPMGAWLKRELAPLLGRILSRESVERRGLLDWDVVRETVSLHERNREDHTDHLIALMNLELWCRLYLDRESAADLTDTIKAA